MQVDNRRPQTAQVYQSELKTCTGTGAQTNIEENTKPRTDALAQGPSETLRARRKGDLKVWSGVCAESSADPPGNTNTTTYMRDPRTGGQQKTPPTAQAYQCEQTACTGAGHKQTQENAQESRPLTDALAQAPSKTLLVRRKVDTGVCTGMRAYKSRRPSRDHRHYNKQEAPMHLGITEDRRQHWHSYRNEHSKMQGKADP